MISIIVPVYNRREEVADLLESAARQTDSDFEVVIVEDGSTEPCQDVVGEYEGRLKVKYFFRENEGRSPARNYGMKRADGDFFIFVDSDCVLPSEYIANVKKEQTEHPADCFGGPDAAHESFSPLQKAISFAMTSFLTTGGIRGGKRSLEKFVPRTFNMGFSRRVWQKVGGFREMFSEDIDMSTRIRREGFSIALYADAPVYHKRRVSFGKFWRQVHVFGQSRITLKLLYPGSMKVVHTLPALFVICVLALIIGAIWYPWLLVPLGLYLLALFVAAMVSLRSVKTASMAVVASMVQLFGYGTGFIKAYVWQILLGNGRNTSRERELRRGK